MLERKVQASLDPETVVFSSKIGPFPAVARAQMKRPRKTMGTKMDLAQKKYLILVGWMRMKGNWINQKRKKQSIPALVMLDDAGRWLGKFRKLGAKAMSICLTHSDPERVVERRDTKETSERKGGREGRETRDFFAVEIKREQGGLKVSPV